MKNTIVKSGIISLFFIYTMCSNKRDVSIYMMPYFEKGQKVYVDINDGDFKFEKIYRKNHSNDEYLLIKKYKNQNESIKVYFKTFGKDTLLVLPKDTKKILLGFNIDKEIFISTEKDLDVWKKY